MGWPARSYHRGRAGVSTLSPGGYRIPGAAADWRLAVAGPNTGTGRAASAPVARLPRTFSVSAVRWPMAASVAERVVQRSVHPRVSRQYQRRSVQALPPSATIWSADKRMPHIQQDLTGAGSPQNGAECC